jgi:hypothetical protein
MVRSKGGDMNKLDCPVQGLGETSMRVHKREGGNVFCAFGGREAQTHNFAKKKEASKPLCVIWWNCYYFE